jgi:hypothetical protein
MARHRFAMRRRADARGGGGRLVLIRLVSRIAPGMARSRVSPPWRPPGGTGWARCRGSSACGSCDGGHLTDAKLRLRVLFTEGVDEFVYKVVDRVPHGLQVFRNGDAICTLPPSNSGGGHN